MTASGPPPPSVLAAFGLAGAPVRLEGGEGKSWRIGNSVLKPSGLIDGELDWQADLMDRLADRDEGFRVARFLRAADGSVVVEGWCAQEYLPGRYARRWPEILAIGERFHAALRDEPRPPFIESRDDPWAIGDRVAWGEQPLGDLGRRAHVARLASVRRPLDAPSQLIHGDLAGNVLFDDPKPPAVIDLSPYWRPAPFGLAIVVADALIWEGADESILGLVAHIDDFEQYFLRALMYRAVTARVFADLRPGSDEAEQLAPVVRLALRLAAP